MSAHYYRYTRWPKGMKPRAIRRLPRPRILAVEPGDGWANHIPVYELRADWGVMIDYTATMDSTN